MALFRPRSTQPAVLLVSDLPTWGRVALASAVPLVEAAGFQACALPTALLSSHGAYPGFVLEPQTVFLGRAWDHLKTLGLKFRGAAFGLVGDQAQFPLLEQIADSIHAQGGLVLVDPILGDHGRRYGLFHEDYVPAFRSLVSLADIITPNLTEAALLLGEDPLAPRADLNRWLTALARLGPSKVVITSAPFADHPDRTGVVWYDAKTDQQGQIVHQKLGQGIPGTGDALAARLLTGLLQGRPFPRALDRAVRQTLADLRRSQRVGRPALWGPEGPLLP